MIKNLDKWLLSYMGQGRSIKKKRNAAKNPVHVMFCCVDHFEPDWSNADKELQINRVKRWVKEYPEVASKHQDADGCYPKHSFFYPAEVYNKDHLDLLADLCSKGFGEVEVHLHHDNDTEPGFLKKLNQAKKDFGQHGLLGKRKLSGHTRFAFIHGNWALNNSRKDGHWCGVNNESKILSLAGCYADFTYPSAPSETQPRIINSIYYSSSHRYKAKTHNKGPKACVGQFAKDDLMLIQGPLALNWRRRKMGLLPSIENADITGNYHPTEDRVDLWVDQWISVEGKPDWIFIKVHTHGAHEVNADMLLGEPFDKMCTYLEKKYNDGNNYVLHYVTAREMYNIVKAAEAGESKNPNEYRDYMIERNVK